MFLADEFNVLNDDPVDFESLPEEHRVLIGCDDIDLLQAFEFLLSQNKMHTTHRSFNSFVAQNLSSEIAFLRHTPEEQQDILGKYWDCLDRIDHQYKRAISFILEAFLPLIEAHLMRREFLMHSKKGIRKQIELSLSAAKEFQHALPPKDFIKNLSKGGIQVALKEKDNVEKTPTGKRS